MYTREKHVAQPEPSAPMARTPKCPYTRIQLPATFTRFAVMSANMIGVTRFMACKYRRKAK